MARAVADEGSGLVVGTDGHVGADEAHEPGVGEREQLPQPSRRRTTRVVHEEAQPPRADALEPRPVGSRGGAMRPQWLEAIPSMAVNAPRSALYAGSVRRATSAAT